ncbi:hypothetical protein SCLCIDRAFT_1223557 [Scleroderma citrinum Foug A]|uniref:Uncharacterized protein n=1 Tax=Scleroderma citrinum Foug A TaxID=1036808 RepID=A0A0C2ZIP5_9AGAM|nr:hypothetical protein SCLCIDRAFT_1223557 [Scleroderma citrinum Foug A]
MVRNEAFGDWMPEFWDRRCRVSRGHTHSNSEDEDAKLDDVACTTTTTSRCWRSRSVHVLGYVMYDRSVHA